MKLKRNGMNKYHTWSNENTSSPLLFLSSSSPPASPSSPPPAAAVATESHKEERIAISEGGGLEVFKIHVKYFEEKKLISLFYLVWFWNIYYWAVCYILLSCDVQKLMMF